MTTTLDEAVSMDAGASRRLRQCTAAVRVSFTWFGTRKALTTAQKAEAASTFGAEEQFLAAGKKLLDTRHPRFKAVTAVRTKAIAYWRAVSLPYPEPGIRLIRQDRLDTFSEQLRDYRGELLDAVEQLDEHFGALKAAARERLGRLFDSADYPDSLSGLFAVDWDFPSVEPPTYLQQLNPELYAQECQRVTARFDEAIQLAEQAFAEELAKLVDRLTERLQGHEDGKPKIFRDSAVGNLGAFFERFRSLNVRSNPQLDELVTQCQRIVQGVDPHDLRSSQPLRQQIASQLSVVTAAMDGLLMDRPRRRICERPMSEPAMELVIERSGHARCIYGETLSLANLGPLTIRRASHVEPTSDGCWQVDLSPVDGAKLGPFAMRSHALAAEYQWLREHWLVKP